MISTFESAKSSSIVSTARELFRSKGYAGASMNDLADAVGLKKSSLYVRFPNKEALVPAVLDLTLQ
jgi:TetR/AcrR family transcriptional regulator, transcriptional repressor for nem operon